MNTQTILPVAPLSPLMVMVSVTEPFRECSQPHSLLSHEQRIDPLRGLDALVAPEHQYNAQQFEMGSSFDCRTFVCKKIKSKTNGAEEKLAREKVLTRKKKSSFFLHSIPSTRNVAT